MITQCLRIIKQTGTCFHRPPLEPLNALNSAEAAEGFSISVVSVSQRPSATPSPHSYIVLSFDPEAKVTSSQRNRTHLSLILPFWQPTLTIAGSVGNPFYLPCLSKVVYLSPPITIRGEKDSTVWRQSW
jgi:hypothetical protein